MRHDGRRTRELHRLWCPILSKHIEQSFVRKGLAEKLQAGHFAIFPLAAIRHLQKLWISLLEAIPQTGRKPRLIYDLSWSGLNKIAKSAAQKYVVLFGKSLQSIPN